MFERMNATTTRAALAAAVVGCVLLSCWLLWWRRPPQMGSDEETAKTVDALFTAVTSRDKTRLDHCERRLRVLKGDERLPRGASDYLDGLITMARAGNWQAAAKKLYWFMKEQRRDDNQTRRPSGQAARGAASGGLLDKAAA